MAFKLPGIRISIFGKLLIGIIAILILLSLISFVGLRSIKNLEIASRNILDESIEHYNINSLGIKINQLVMPVNDYLIHGNLIEKEHYTDILKEVESQFKVCELFSADNPDDFLCKELPFRLEEINLLAEKIFSIQDPVGNVEGTILMETVDLIVERTTEEIDAVLQGKLMEIDRYLNLTQSVNNRANRLIILLGAVTAFSLLIGGFFYVKEITSPIKKLLQVTEKVTSGDLSATADVKTKTSDEMEDLANSFNSMIDVLKKSTVSRDFFYSIIAQMIDSLIITGQHGQIRIVNQSTLDLLGYGEGELIGQPVEMVMHNNSEPEPENVTNVFNTYLTKEGNSIPVLFSRSLIYDKNKNISGMVMIASSNNGNATHETADMVQSDINSGNTQHNGSENPGPARNIKSIGPPPLTARELEIIKLIAEGFSNREIAEKLFISVRTVETHRKNLMQKLHIKSVISMVHYAVKNGLI